MKNDPITVSEFNALINQTLNFAYPEVVVEGEVASYKLNQGKWVFFDLKDEVSVVGCFIPIFQLKSEIEDGMKIRVTAVPQLTKWGKFSLTVRSVELAGEGSVKRAFELLKSKLTTEGIFDESRKRSLPEIPQRILLITSKQAAAYNDFVTIINDRWAGLDIDHLHVQVQGEQAPGQITSAINYANTKVQSYDVVVLIRGGGSFEDLQAFNTEEVTRAVFGCKVPIVVAIGHEDDVSLAELAADLRAATPTDAARRLVPDSKEMITKVKQQVGMMSTIIQKYIIDDRSLLNRYFHSLELRLASLRQNNAELLRRCEVALDQTNIDVRLRLEHLEKLLRGLDPQAILARGYSIARVGSRVIKSSSDISLSDTVMLQLHQGKVSLQRSKTQSNDEQEQITIKL